MPESRRSQRQQAVAELRAQGRYGPELRDVLPAFTGLALAAAGLVVALAWLYRALGVGGLMLGVILLAAVTVVGWRWRRVAVRRRGGIYTPAELTALDEHGLAVAAERMLQRDGWHVISMPDAGRPRLYARDRGGRRLDVGFRPADEGSVEEDTLVGPPPALTDAGRPGADGPIRVVVSQVSYGRTDVLWASRSGVRVIDGRRLQQWASGTSLDDLDLPG
ncbi:hypothetical protein AB0D84_18215 [Streptomyces sp. NPDC048193]|uniref:hypothetical protein n=1 Tax=unclassified Streptomyces TaxID=2593676 RepID=UPI003435BA13